MRPAHTKLRRPGLRHVPCRRSRMGSRTGSALRTAPMGCLADLEIFGGSQSYFGQISLAYFLHGDRDSGFKNMFKGLAHLDVSDDSIWCSTGLVTNGNQLLSLCCVPHTADLCIPTQTACWWMEKVGDDIPIFTDKTADSRNMLPKGTSLVEVGHCLINHFHLFTTLTETLVEYWIYFILHSY